jgi:hypothetical protein
MGENSNKQTNKERERLNVIIVVEQIASENSKLELLLFKVITDVRSKTRKKKRVETLLLFFSLSILSFCLYPTLFSLFSILQCFCFSSCFCKLNTCCLRYNVQDKLNYIIKGKLSQRYM